MFYSAIKNSSTHFQRLMKFETTQLFLKDGENVFARFDGLPTQKARNPTKTGPSQNALVGLHVVTSMGLFTLWRKTRISTLWWQCVFTLWRGSPRCDVNGRLHVAINDNRQTSLTSESFDHSLFPWNKSQKCESVPIKKVSNWMKNKGRGSTRKRRRKWRQPINNNKFPNMLVFGVLPPTLFA